MDIPPSAAASGDVVELRRTDTRHMPSPSERAPSAPDGAEARFGSLLLGALDGVNEAQVRSGELTRRMITEPDSVNVQDSMIAGSEATLAISMTKTIVERALAAYREVMNLR